MTSSNPVQPPIHPTMQRVPAWVAAAFTLALISACSRDQAADTSKTAAGVPVVVTEAVRKDVPIRIEGIGNVEAITSVAVKARVDGQIMRLGIRDGADVAKSQVLFEIDPRPLRAQLQQAQAKLAGDIAQLERARDQDKRYQDLLQKKFISPDAYNQIKANLDSAQATADADRAAIENARLQVEFATLRSPIAGRAGRIQVQTGNMVKANDTVALVTINQLQPIYVNFAVPEKYLAQIQQAMKKGECKVVISGRSDEGVDTPAEGTLTFVDNAVDTTTGTIRLRATVANRDATLWPGQFVHAAATVGDQRGAVVVPADAVQNGPKGTYVYIVDEAAKAQMKPVSVGLTSAGDSVIDSGLKGGELVVVDGQSRLLPGVLVAMQRPAKP